MERTTTEQPILLDVEALKTWFSSTHEPSWLKTWRMQGIERWDEYLWPESRYTRLTGFHPERFALFPPCEPSRQETDDPLAYIRVSSKGIESITLPQKYASALRIHTFQELLAQDDSVLKNYYHEQSFQIPFEFGRPALFLHTLWTTGLWIEIGKGADEINPTLVIEIDHQVNESTTILPVVLKVHEYQRGQVVFHHKGAQDAGTGLGIFGVDIRVQEGGQLQIHQLNGQHEKTFGFHFLAATLDRNATLESAGGLLGHRLLMSRNMVKLAGEGATLHDTQVLFGHEKQHFDAHSFTHHIAPNTSSQVRVRGVLKDRARSVFYGLVRIDHGAKNSQAHLEDHVLILNPGAHADAIPALEIEENEVRCSHSASVGKIDEEKIFYAMSRGMDEATARQLIVEGFLHPILEQIRVDTIRNRIVELITAKWHRSQTP